MTKRDQDDSRPIVTPWGQALDRLFRRWENVLYGQTLAEMCRRAKIERGEWWKILHQSKKGPSIEKMDALLDAMDATWNDWARFYTPLPREQVMRKAHHQGKRKPSAA